MQRSIDRLPQWRLITYALSKVRFHLQAFRAANATGDLLMNRLRFLLQDLLTRNLQRFGYSVVRFPVMRFFREHNIDVILDVGANAGQYGSELRRLGYKGRMVSFEPSSAAYAKLAERASHDPHWATAHFALGSMTMEHELHIAGNSVSSSFLEMLPKHTAVAPESAFVNSEAVSIKRLDSIFHHYCNSRDEILLKIDTQGYERQVLEGATGVLSNIVGLQLEMSLTPLYEGEAPAESLIALARDHGFTLVWIQHGFKDSSTQQLLQVDGLFFRLPSATRLKRDLNQQEVAGVKA